MLKSVPEEHTAAVPKAAHASEDTHIPSRSTHQVAADQEGGEIHENPRGDHEEHGVAAQDVEQSQVVDPGVPQHLRGEHLIRVADT